MLKILMYFTWFTLGKASQFIVTLMTLFSVDWKAPWLGLIYTKELEMLKIKEFSLVKRLTFTLVHLRPFYTSTFNLWAWTSYEVNNVQMAPWRITWEMSFTSSQYLFSSSWSKSYTAFGDRDYHKFKFLLSRPQGNGISSTCKFSWLYVCFIPIITPLTSHITILYLLNYILRAWTK